MSGVPFEACETVRVALVGAGGRGRSLMHDLLGVPGTEVRAVWDPNPASVAKATETAGKKGAQPEAFHAPEDLLRVLDRDDVDLVLVASPWDHHTPQAAAAMRAGKHVAVEVPAAGTVEECWQLVETSEKTRRHCVMLENCCYGQTEMTVLQMAREGVFGDLTHAEAAYIHDLRSVLFDGEYEGPWRRQPHTERDGNFYPTHGLGPVAWYLGVGTDDRFQYMVSMSSRERALTEFRNARHPERADEHYRAGDMNSSLIRTARGRTILLQHDVVSPRPYDRLNFLSGTKGAFADYPARLYLDGQETHAWQPLDEETKARYQHPLWKEVGALAAEGGHGGMDFAMLYRLVRCIQLGLPPDMDVYDAADWSVPGPLSELSVARRSAPVDFPDFRRKGAA